MLDKVWEYIIQIEIPRSRAASMEQEYKACTILSRTSPGDGGWNEVFNALILRGDFDKAYKITGCSAYQKELLNLVTQ